jgi:dolichol-phosphate mannosyltransferase
MSAQSFISIVIPVHNEVPNLKSLCERLIACSDKWKANYEIVFVDDGSSDGSTRLLRELVDSHDHISLIVLSRNFGQQAAINAGLHHATGDGVVVMDSDFQDPPEVIEELIEKWKAGYEVVYAIRKKRKEPWITRFLYSIFYRLLRIISKVNIPLDSGDFCLLDRAVVDVLKNQMPENTRFMRGLRAFAGYNQIGVEYERHERFAGSPSYNFNSLLKLALDGIFDFSTVPLRIMTLLGLFLSVTSFGLGVFFIIHRVVDFKVLGYSPADVPGMASLIVSLFFIGGSIILMLGILGEYIGRIYFEVKRRPNYIISEIVTNKARS